ncbi:MAG TPA: hypothetical protein VF712_13895 [Thermoleophilaceae bacterium]|jgi:hypothetical protein
MSDAQLTRRIRSRIHELSGDVEVAGVLIETARKANLPLADACALIQVESTFRNVYGHDRVRNPIKSPDGGVLRVTAANFREYKRHWTAARGIKASATASSPRRASRTAPTVRAAVTRPARTC